MTVRALLMAGGTGERMRRSAGPVPKPLVPICGVSLLERNLALIVAAGVRDVVVSVPARIPEIGRFAESRGAALVTALGGRLSVLEEQRPLGNVGCAAELRGTAEMVLLTFADNLTALDLGGVLAAHRSGEAALTLATHVESVPIPFGALRLDGGRVIEYREKPRLPVRICSGVAVLGDEALAALELGRRAGLSELAGRLLGRRCRIAAFPHSAPWVDVNDAGAVRRAEELVAAHPAAFDQWAGGEPPSALDLLVLHERKVLLRGQGRGMRSPWDIPSVRLKLGSRPCRERIREVVRELPVVGAEPRRLSTFDHLDERTGQVVRHHLFFLEATSAPSGQRDGVVWMTPSRAVSRAKPGTRIARSLAIAGWHEPSCRVTPGRTKPSPDGAPGETHPHAGTGLCGRVS